MRSSRPAHRLTMQKLKAIAAGTLALCFTDCSSTPDAGGDTGPAETAGTAATGGNVAAGGNSATNGSGGMSAGLGGSLGGSGAHAGSGGMTGSGGVTASGGMIGSGGITDSGGANTGGTTNCIPPNPPSANDSVTIDMSVASGAPSYPARGFIYGISQDGSQSPLTTLSDIKIQHLRSGGAQIGCPNGGYVNGQYSARWNAVKAYHDKAKAIGATLLVLVHDIWGADAVCKVPRWPGGGGDWTEYTSFITQLITDMKANYMTGPDVRWE